MSSVPINPVFSGAAGSAAAQTASTDTERAQQAAASRQRRLAAQQQAASAAGVAATDGENLRPNQRDADGRLPWQRPVASSPDRDDQAARQPKPNAAQSDRGQQLDLLG